MKKRLIHSALFLFIFTALLSYYSEAKPVPQKQYRVPHVDGKIKADGVLDEDVWQKALMLELKYEVRPGENIPAPVKTEVLVAYSQSRLYIAFKAYDPDPSQILARLGDRDNNNNQDWVAVMLDTFNDKRRSFDLLVTPMGIQSDFIEVNGSNGADWDAIWDSGGKINEHGYFVEMSVPFSSLRFQRVNGEQVWNFDAVRSYPRSVKHHIGLFPRDRNNNCYLCQSIQLVGFKGVKPGKNIEIDPTIASHVTQEREDGTEPFVKDKGFEPGITGHWGVTPNLTLSGTVNPDFSQVEADALKLDINQPFALYFQEKRPFFIEGADYFDTRFNVVHTRTLRDPSWGMKLTGKEGTNTVGTYLVRDTLTNLIFPGPQSSDSTSLEMESSAAVLRYKRDLGRNYTLGALFTNRQGDDYYNRVFGVDGDFRFTARDQIKAQFLTSYTRYPLQVAQEFEQSKEQFSDWALDFLYLHRSRNLNWRLGYKEVGPNFRADQGFIPQVGYRFLFAGADYVWNAKPGQWWTRFQLRGHYYRRSYRNGDLMDREMGMTLTYEGPMQIHSFVNFEKSWNIYEGIEFPRTEWVLHHCMKPIPRMHWYAKARLGDRIDYSNIRPGKRVNLTSGIVWDLGLHWHLELSHTYERMKVESQRLYTANQSEVRLAYQFNKRTRLRAIVQYVDYRYNTDMYIDEKDPLYRHIFSQILFSYKVNPQTVLYLGYSDNYSGYQFTGLPQVNRTVFLKIGYAFII